MHVYVYVVYARLYVGQSEAIKVLNSLQQSAKRLLTSKMR